jgi:arginine N-succinyltransferase
VFVIRDARAADLDGLQAVARHLDSVNLPDDRERLRALIAASEESFAGRADLADRRFLFVLIDANPATPSATSDASTERLLGTSMIFAQHGSRRAPHVYFDVIEEERYSATLDRHFVHRILRIGYNYKGLTEIGGLVLLPEMRRHQDRLGMLLSYVRFLYMATHRSIFRDEVLSELMPPLEPDGTSRLWEALGRKFTGLSYQEADHLSHENKEFIRALFPEEPIYATLLPPEVQTVIGQVGPETRGVEAMLRRIGFDYAQRIDPFDGGPHFHARVDDVTLVRQTRKLRVGEADTKSIAMPSGAKPVGAKHSGTIPSGATRFLIAAEAEASAEPAHRPRFRAISVVAVADGSTILLSEQERRLLSVEVGTEIACLPLDPPATTPRGA